MSMNLSVDALRYGWLVSLLQCVLLAAAACGTQKKSTKKSSQHRLETAAANGNVTKAKQALAEGAKLNAPCPETNYPALHVAAKIGHLRVVRFLLAHGADVRARNYTGYTAMLEGCAGGKTAVVASLVEGGSALTTREQRGGAGCLHLAARGNHRGLVIYLVSKGMDVNDVAKPSGLTPLAHAVRSGHLAMVDQLLAKGARLDHPRKRPALSVAVDAGWLPMVKHVVKAGADPRQAPHHEAVHVAAKSGRIAALKYLAEQGADLARTSPSAGGTPLQLATRAKMRHVVRFIKERLAAPVRRSAAGGM